MAGHKERKQQVDFTFTESQARLFLDYLKRKGISPKIPRSEIRKRLGEFKISCIPVPEKVGSRRVRLECVSREKRDGKGFLFSRYALGAGAALVPNPDLLWSLKLPQRVLGVLSERRPLLWARDPLTRVWFPLWPEAKEARRIRQFSSGRIGYGDLSPMERRSFRETGILIPEETVLNRMNGRLLARAREELGKQGFTVIRACVPPLSAAALNTYYQTRIDAGFMTYGDRQVRERFVEYDETLAAHLLKSHLDFVSSLVGFPVRPRTPSVVSYEPGACLPPHRDRQELEITVSIQLSGGRKKPWPIYLKDRGKRARGVLLQAPGDAVVFFGSRLEHFRRKLSPGPRVTQLMLHYAGKESEN